MVQRLQTLGWLAAVALTLSATAAAAVGTAQLTAPSVFDFGAFQTVMQTWWTPLWREARWLFITLAAISMAWQFGQLALRRADLGEFFAEFLRYVMFVGFFYWLLVYGVFIGTAFIKSFTTLGSHTTNGGLTLSGMVQPALNMFSKMSAQNAAIDLFSPNTWIAYAVGLLVYLVVIVILGIIYVLYLIKIIGAWFLLYGGIIFLGFGGAKWTSEWAIGYFRALLGACIEVFAMVLIAGLAQGLLKTYFDTLQTNSGFITGQGASLESGAMLLLVVLMFLFLAHKLPPMLAGIVGGSPGSHLGGGGGAELMAAAVGGLSAGIGTAAALATAGKAAGAAMSGGGGRAVASAASKAGEALAGGGIGGGGMGGGGGGGVIPSPVPGVGGGGGSAAGAFVRSLAGSTGQMAANRAARTQMGRAGYHLQSVAKSINTLSGQDPSPASTGPTGAAPESAGTPATAAEAEFVRNSIENAMQNGMPESWAETLMEHAVKPYPPQA